MAPRNTPQASRGTCGACLLVAASFIAAVSTAAAPAAAQEMNPAPSDVELMREALYSCKNLSRSRRYQIDLDVFGTMLELERAHGVPEAYVGMTLAKACIESGYTPDVRGDCKKPGECKAVGMLQLWPWTVRFGVDRTDPVDSARFLLGRVKIGLQGRRLKRRCPNIQSPIEAFRIAWLRINRGPLTRGRQRCHGTPHGLKRLRQWKRNIARQRAEQRAANRRRLKRSRTHKQAWSAAAAFGDYAAVRPQ